MKKHSNKQTHGFLLILKVVISNEANYTQIYNKAKTPHAENYVRSIKKSIWIAFSKYIKITHK